MDHLVGGYQPRWLAREPWKVCRLYRELGLELRNRTAKLRVKAKLREERAPVIQQNNLRAMEFVLDQFAISRKLCSECQYVNWVL
jgi:hypothetical protein